VGVITTKYLLVLLFRSQVPRESEKFLSNFSIAPAARPGTVAGKRPASQFFFMRLFVLAAVMGLLNFVPTAASATTNTKQELTVTNLIQGRRATSNACFSDGTVKNAQKISMQHGDFSTFYALNATNKFGYSAVALGDVNGDGVGDLAVGAHGDNEDGIRAVPQDRRTCQARPKDI